MKLFLDDIRFPHWVYPEDLDENWTIVRNHDEFVRIIQENGVPELISFDHDLSCYVDEQEWTGSSAASYLINYALDNNYDKPIEYMVHSANPSGRLNIKSKMETYKKILGLH